LASLPLNIPSEVTSAIGGGPQGASSGASREAILKEVHTSPEDMLEKYNVTRKSVLQDHRSGSGGGQIAMDPLIFGPSYFFMVKTDANIGGGGLGVEQVRGALAVGTPTFPEWLASQLYSSGSPTNHTRFMRLLTNSATRISSSDIVMDTHEVGETWDGAKQTLAKLTLASRQSLTFQVEYNEYTGAPISNLHWAWIKYTEGVVKGRLLAREENVLGRIIDYATAAFLFVTAPDGKTVEFGCKWTGVFPTAAPFSAFEASQNPGSAVTVSIPYAASYVEPNEDIIFRDFNTIAGGSDVSLGVENGRWKLNFPQDLVT